MKALLLSFGLLTALGAASAEAQMLRFDDSRLEREERRARALDRDERAARDERRRDRDDDDDVRRRDRNDDDDDDDDRRGRGRAYGLSSVRPNQPHDNGLHRGWYKNKDKDKGKSKGRGRDD